VVPAAGWAGTAVLGLPVGFAAYVLVVLPLVVARVVPPTSWSTAFVMVVVAAAVLAGRHRPRWTEVLVLIGAGLIVLGGSLVFQAANLTRLTPDSLDYVQIGSVIAQVGDLGAAEDASAVEQVGDPEGVSEDRVLDKRSVLVALMHAGGEGLYRPSIAPLIGLAGLAGFVWLGREVLRDVGVGAWEAAVLVVAGVLAVVASGRFAFNLFLVNGHLAFAVLIMAFVALCWLAAVRTEPAWAVLAALPLAAGTLARPEAPLMLAVFAVPVVVSGGIPLRIRRFLVGCFGVTVVIWYGFGLAPALDGWSDGAVVGPLGAAAGLVLLSVLAERQPWRRWAPYAPAAAVVCLVAGVAALSVADPEGLRSSLSATWQNQVHGAGYWGATWLVLGPLMGASLLLARFPYRAYWFTGLAAVPPLYLALGFLRGIPYRVGTSDSANRMLMHVLLLGALAVVLTAGSLVAERRADLAERS
jgi:hypothetical protein